MMRLRCVLLLLHGPVLFGGESLQSAVKEIIRSGRLNLQKVGVVAMTASGSTKVALQPARPLKPASNLKILTTAAGVTFLGLDHQYETLLLARGPIRSGVLQGHLVLWGTGDPNISGRFYHGDHLAVLRLFLKALRRHGVGRCTGDLVVDDTYFDRQWFNPTWDRREEGRWYSAQVSSLNLNDNCIDVTVKPTAPGRPAQLSFIPRTRFVTVKGAPLTVSKGKTLITIRRRTGTNAITVRGTVNAKRSVWKDHVAIHDPALFLGHAVADFLARNGVTLGGKVRRVASETRSCSVSLRKAHGKKPPHGRVLLRHLSPLLRDLPVINTRSQNLHAEVLLKAMGAQLYGEGSVAAGAKAIKRFCHQEKIPAEGLLIADGSGLSHRNRSSALTLARTLRVMLQKPGWTAYRNSFALAGKTGTLKDRFRTYRFLHGKVFAKTGYIAGVSTLSGYLVRGQTTWVFSILFNSLPQGLRAAQRLQERIVVALYRAMPKQSPQAQPSR